MKLAVKTSPNVTVYGLKLDDMVKDNVYYSGKKEDGTTAMLKVDWKDRYDEKTVAASAKAAGILEPQLSFRKKIALEKDETGVIAKELTTYDAIQLIKKYKNEGKIADGTPIYTSGKIVLNYYDTKNKETNESIQVREINLDPNGIYLADDIDFSAMTQEDIERSAEFDMELVVKEIYEIEGKTYMKAIVVGYDFIEEMEFQFQQKDVENAFKTLKPYTKIECVGFITNNSNEEPVEVENDDPFMGTGWTIVKKDFKPVYMIHGGIGKTIDTESYSEEKINKAILDLAAYKEDYKAGKTVEVAEKQTPKEEVNWGADISIDDDWDI